MGVYKTDYQSAVENYALSYRTYNVLSAYHITIVID